MKQVIGICGKKGHGKTTFMETFDEEDSFYLSFADPLKRGLQWFFDFSDEQLWGFAKEEVDERYGVTPRQVMQTVGTDWFRNRLKCDLGVKENLWITRFHQEIETMMKDKDCSRIIVEDIRFPDELAAISRYSNSLLFHIDRPDMKDSDTHESENVTAVLEFAKSLASLKVIHVLNDSTEEKFQEKSESLKSTYVK